MNNRPAHDVGPTQPANFTVATALAYAHSGRLEAWIQAYLLAGEWANPALANGLKLQQRWWRGPVEVDQAALQRCCGPEPEMEFRVDPAAWDARTDALAQGFDRLEAIPPLIAEYRDGVLSVRDGNHRHEAIRRRGWPTCWVVVWYNSAADYDADAAAFHARRK